MDEIAFRLMGEDIRDRQRRAARRALERIGRQRLTEDRTYLGDHIEDVQTLSPSGYDAQEMVVSIRENLLVPTTRADDEVYLAVVW